KLCRAAARSGGFSEPVTGGGTGAMCMVREYAPNAVSLDIFLPDMLGWTVLARLKQDAATRHIPVQVVTVEEERHHSLERGAFAYIAKPATSELISEALERIRLYTLPRRKKLLIVEDDAGERFGIEELIRHDDVEIDSVADGAEALARLRGARYDCVVLDLRLPDMSGFDLIERI